MKVKPIPKYILKRIKSKDLKLYPDQPGNVRFYAYLVVIEKELVKITVAVKNKNREWFCKQVAIHGIKSTKCMVKDMAYYSIGGYVVGWHEQGLTKQAKWYESSQWGYSDAKYFDPYAVIVNKECALNLTQYKYSAIDKYKYNDVFKYLKLYEKYPQMEYLTKVGLSCIVTSKQILNLASKDKRFRKWLLLNREKLDVKNYYVASIISAYKTGRELHLAQRYEEIKKSMIKHANYNDVKNLLDTNADRFIQYLEKKRIYSHTYLDYLYACSFLGLDLSLNKNRYPNDFTFWHNVRINEYNQAKVVADEKAKKEFEKNFVNVSNKYLSMQMEKHKKYIVLIARNVNELKKEGEVLHHCVGRMDYDRKFVNEESLIFFIRSKENPTQPLYTIEYSLKDKSILQCHGEHNKAPTKIVEAFIRNTWLPFANKQIKTIA